MAVAESNLKAGRELDALVAEEVMGEVVVNAPCGDGLTRTDEFYGPTMEEAGARLREGYARHVKGGMRLWEPRYIGPEYSTDISAAWQVVEKLQGDAWSVKIKQFYPTSALWDCELYRAVRWQDCGCCNIKEEHESCADTAPLAICLAALKAVGYK